MKGVIERTLTFIYRLLGLKVLSVDDPETRFCHIFLNDASVSMKAFWALVPKNGEGWGIVRCWRIDEKGCLRIKRGMKVRLGLEDASELESYWRFGRVKWQLMEFQRCESI